MRIAASVSFFALGVALVADGCAHRRSALEEPASRVGAVDVEAFAPPPVESAETSPAEPIPMSPPRVLDRPLPKYPGSAVADGIECRARVLYHILPDGHGKLVSLEWEAPPPPEHVEAFETALRAAVAAWTFEPAVVLKRKALPDGSYRWEEQRIPVAEYARVRFRVVDGVPVVEH